MSDAKGELVVLPNRFQQARLETAARTTIELSLYVLTTHAERIERARKILATNQGVAAPTRAQACKEVSAEMRRLVTQLNEIAGELENV